MTTIAWDGKTLAADKRVSCNGVSDGKTTKIVRRKKDGALCGTAGNTSLGAAFKRWFLAGEKGKAPNLKCDSEEANAFIVRPNGHIVVHDFSGWYEIESTKFANGSGWEIALGAMHAGASAEEAVRIAAKLDGNTSDDIDVLELKT